MKKLKLILIGICLGITICLVAQNDTTAVMKGFSREVEANFLSSYYQQDGNNAAVTGGIGTEQLTDVSNIIILNVPLDSTHAINLYSGVDIYSSASTDKIDNIVSSASSQDVRGFATISYSWLNLYKGETYSVKAGFSKEYDYTSFSAGFSYTREWNEANTELTFAGQAFLDNWLLIYPIELRGEVQLPSSGRQSYNGQLLFSQILSRKTQVGLSAEVIYMSGTLSTPFHRVYFSDTDKPTIERLPNSRLKVPLSVRFNYFPIDNLVVRTYYRYYWDDFNLTGHTAEIELPVKLGSVFTVSPFYRYHTQTAADYFAPYQGHLSTEEFYTSDYDLSALSSHKYGLGFKYFPLYGLARSKPVFDSKRIFMIKYLELRGGYYQRSNGLTSFIASLNIGFSLK